MTRYRLADGTLSTDYGVGDEFILTKDHHIWVKNKVVRLEEDDYSTNPWFIDANGEVRCCAWGKLKKTGDKMQSTLDKIKVMQAYVDGGEVQFKLDNRNWICFDAGCTPPYWDWGRVSYRIKPQPQPQEMTLVDVIKELGRDIKIVK